MLKSISVDAPGVEKCLVPIKDDGSDIQEQSPLSCIVESIIWQYDRVVARPIELILCQMSLWSPGSQTLSRALGVKVDGFARRVKLGRRGHVPSNLLDGIKELPEESCMVICGERQMTLVWVESMEPSPQEVLLKLEAQLERLRTIKLAE